MQHERMRQGLVSTTLQVGMPAVSLRTARLTGWVGWDFKFEGDLRARGGPREPSPKRERATELFWLGAVSYPPPLPGTKPGELVWSSLEPRNLEGVQVSEECTVCVPCKPLRFMR